jgi:hypothetical protein
MPGQKPTISFSPDPLAHDAMATITWTGLPDDAWAEAALGLPDGTFNSHSWHHLTAGETTFTIGPTPTWDGVGGGVIYLWLYEFRNGIRHNVADSTGDYLA